MRLPTAREHAPDVVLRFANQFTEATGIGLVLPTVDSLAADAPISAVVNWGRWVVECPDCASAQEYDPTWPWFLCVHCWNAGTNGQWRPVTTPDDATVADIETALLARPNDANRHWDGIETVADLLAENDVMLGTDWNTPAPVDTPTPPDQVINPLTGQPIPPGLLIAAERGKP